MTNGNLISIFVLAAALYAVRMLPLTLIRREIKSTWVRSFLYYVPYVTLTVMTFPAILTATNSPVSALSGFAVAVVLAVCNQSLFKVAIGGCLTVFLVELLPFV